MSWNVFCAQAGCELAERVAIDTRRFSDDELNRLLVDTGPKICLMISRECAPDPIIVKGLDVISAVFETRLIALEATMPAAGHA